MNLRWKGEGDIYNKEFMDALQGATDEVFYIPGVNRTKVSSLFTPSTYYIEITEQGFNGEPVVPAKYSGLPEELEQVRKNVALSGQIGLIVANDLKGAMIRADLQDYDPSKGQEGQRVDYWEVQQKLTEIRQKFENQNVRGQHHRLCAPAGRRHLRPARRVHLLRRRLPDHHGAAVLVHALGTPHRGGADRGAAAGAVAAGHACRWPAYGIDPLSILVPFLIFSIGVSVTPCR